MICLQYAHKTSHSLGQFELNIAIPYLQNSYYDFSVLTWGISLFAVLQRPESNNFQRENWKTLINTVFPYTSTLKRKIDLFLAKNVQKHNKSVYFHVKTPKFAPKTNENTLKYDAFNMSIAYF